MCAGRGAAGKSAGKGDDVARVLDGAGREGPGSVRELLGAEHAEHARYTLAIDRATSSTGAPAHEAIGHCWSLRDWARDPSAKDAWLDAIARDGTAPSTYAALSFRKSGLPHEDVAEATALYFLVLGTPGFDAHRAAMPARFALLAARFGG